MTEETNALPNGYNLHRYQIEGVLGAGGFGITYRAIHEALQNEVAIKEYFPAEWAYRDHDSTTVRANAQGQIPARQGEPPCYQWGLERFLDEAKILVQVNHPGVVRVRDYFSANGSAYIVMEYEDGESLSAMLQRGGILPEHEVHRLLDDIMPALEAVHSQNYLHRDLKPSNLYIRSRDGHVMLLDFGAARQALGRRTRRVTSVVTPGYSPIEQYVTVGEDYGPWTDIYALGAVMYRCITGAPPIEAPGRVLKDPVQPAVEVGAGLYSRGLLQVIDQALAVRPEDRFQSVPAMRQALQAADRSNSQADFSHVPPIKTELLDLPSSASLRFEPLAPQSGASLPSTRWPNHPLSAPHPPEPPKRRSVPSYPSTPANDPREDRRELRSLPSESGLDWTLDHIEPPASPRITDIETASAPLQSTESDLSLPMLENIWEHLDKSESEASPTTLIKQPPQQPSQEPSESLLKRSPKSALEHLKKVSSKRVNSTSIPIERVEPLSSPRSRTNPVGEEAAAPQTTPSTAPESVPELTKPASGIRSVNWKRVLLSVFAISGLSGISLLSYEYYQAAQTQRQLEIAALEKQQKEELAQLAQEAARQRETELIGYIDQARKAIASRAWDQAHRALDQAAAIDRQHPALATVQSELLSAQRSTTSSQTFTDNTVGMELKWIEGGCFNMGSPLTERDRGSDEPIHRVCPAGFWMGKTEVTNSQFRRFKPQHDSGSFQGRSLNADTQPAVNLSWDDAQAFAEWLTWESGAGKRFRLPTEAEWEYAARAGTTTRYYWGDLIDPRYANFSDRNDPTGASIGNLDDGQSVTTQVGSYLPNSLGLHDVAGNVWEWTCSEYYPRYAGEEERCSAKRSNQGQRVARGGSWNNGAGDLRSAKRLPRKPSDRDGLTGFRVIMED
ncbi:MAG: SUMF1/EgtB/PvdO family nonheme iron enzyme [Gammaproteobacteria bacterium]|nr:SUMF1/EgtB/PvdO family nonheme iron enzyme [Gammaproteobacteria bacterium]MCP5196161.1 SUMF1/EgtB/PvdO family nonheme iron enzyme [Gammaproteobacteria bacterium]